MGIFPNVNVRHMTSNSQCESSQTKRSSQNKHRQRVTIAWQLSGDVYRDMEWPSWRSGVTV